MANPLYDTLFGRHADNESAFLKLSGGGALSYREFLARSAQFAAFFSGRGLAPGDRVAIQVAKSPEALMIYAACVQAGFVFLPLNTAYTTTEMAYFIENSGAKLLVCDPAREADLTPVAHKTGARVETLAPDGFGSLTARAMMAPERFATVDRGEDDLAAFLYTSGTTGRSKGAMLTQRNLLSNAEALVSTWRFTADDVLLHALPIFHSHGLFVACNVTLMAGGAMIFLPGFDRAEVLERLPEATAMMGVPTFYTRLLDDPGFTGDATRHMRVFISGSAPLLAETHRRFEDRTGHRILERYGMTETNMNTSNPYDGERRAGTVGLPLPGVEVRVRDAETGEPVPDGEIGVLEVRGPNVFTGYWQMPEKTAEELRPDGFFITGDLAQIGADGYVTIVGREKDLIISGGYNVYPREVEDVLDGHPGILESAVIGVPDADFGETPLAVLVAEDGAAPDLDALRSAVAAELARYKHPSRYEIVDALPRNTMGKVQKTALRERFG
ncbi:Long-chain-fatty-acid--CoA ligase [Roseivivax jejudonensis]|uniref:Long-chain-fatty-acid--CoA ligase n=1 Tax=Roseivivax jejudonensis TaxID=1529041 RepID=A0A1X7A4B4_9RHOB|nr:malonyl-CoA synthase [Roseivivax jejudonensis]SLN69806.1 Long-chain-fatty-acid--CoA ligase [Roseivivax jejudonensis]